MSNSAKTVSVAVIETDMTEVRQHLDNFVDNEHVQAMTAFNTMLDNIPPGKWVKKTLYRDDTWYFSRSPAPHPPYTHTVKL